MEGEGDFELIDCNTCGRHFRSDILVKHEPICIKNSKKKRKIFNSGKQRAEGSDIPINKILKPGEIPKPDPKSAIAAAKTKNWREKHNLLVESFRAARDYAKAKSCGAPLPPPAPALIDSSLIQCPYCQRRFNEESSKRHIPFCKEHQVKVVPKPSNAPTKKPLLLKSPVPKPKAEPLPQKVPTQSSNGSRTRTTPQSIMRPNSRSEDVAVRTTNSSGSSRGTVVRTEPPPAVVVAPVIQPPRANATRGNIPTFKSSSLPRGPTTTKKSNIPAGPRQPATTAGFCHDCGNAYLAPTARFCSECGVRRLAI